MRTILLYTGMTALAAAGRAQPATVSFEVASVKSNSSPDPAAFEITPGRLSIRNTDLGHPIMRAYGLSERNFASVGGYLPVLTGRYDIDARAAQPAGPAEMMRMLQVLLADRFRLAMHRETREVNGYALLVDRRPEASRALGGRGGLHRRQ